MPLPNSSGNLRDHWDGNMNTKQIDTWMEKLFDLMEQLSKLNPPK
jgi:hypothetical protein